MTVASPFADQLGRLSDQGESVGAARAGLAEGLGEIPAAKRSAWRRVLTGIVKAESIEAWVVEPCIHGCKAAGLEPDAVTRFLEVQGTDERRHEALLLAYIERHWPDEV